MKIGSNPGPVSEALGTERNTRSAEVKSGEVKAVKSAEVAISPLASKLAGAEGEFDAKKVDAIKQAIRDGKFQVNAEAVADKLIAHAAELATGKMVQ